MLNLIRRGTNTLKAYAAKEVYMGYYWLVLVIDPYKIDSAVYSWKADNQIGMPIPDCVKTAMRETGERGKSTQIHHPRGIFVLEDDDDQMYFYNLDNLFEWHIKKGIRLLHTRDGKPLTNTEDLKRLWADNLLKPIPTDLENPKLIGFSHKNFSKPIPTDLENPKLYPKWHFDRL